MKKAECLSNMICNIVHQYSVYDCTLCSWFLSSKDCKGCVLEQRHVTIRAVATQSILLDFCNISKDISCKNKLNEIFS